jgi:hypothetical protein
MRADEQMGGEDLSGRNEWADESGRTDGWLGFEWTE